MIQLKDIPEGFVLVSIDPSFSMLSAGWEICGTDLALGQPNPEKIRVATELYRRVLEASGSRTKYALKELQSKTGGRRRD